MTYLDDCLWMVETDDECGLTEIGEATLKAAKEELAALRKKAALADDLYRIWSGHESQCKGTMYLEHWMERYEAIK